MQQENNSSTLNSGSLQISGQNGVAIKLSLYTERCPEIPNILKNDKNLANHIQHCSYKPFMSYYQNSTGRKGVGNV